MAFTRLLRPVKHDTGSKEGMNSAIDYKNCGSFPQDVPSGQKYQWLSLTSRMYVHKLPPSTSSGRVAKCSEGAKVTKACMSQTMPQRCLTLSPSRDFSGWLSQARSCAELAIAGYRFFWAFKSVRRGKVRFLGRFESRRQLQKMLLGEAEMPRKSLGTSSRKCI